MKILSIIAMALFFMGCSTIPLHNIENEKIDPAQSKSHVKSVIMQSGKARRWKMREKSSSTLRATLFSRKHELKVDIPYSGKAFSIIYVDSKNMKYDGENIHKKYGKWIEVLRRDIQRNM